MPAVDLSPTGRSQLELTRLARPVESDRLAVGASQLSDFMSYCERQTARRFADSAAFHAFSVSEYRLFWSLFLRWSGVAIDGSIDPVCTDDLCERAVFFPELRLGYVEHLLRLDDELHAGRTAITACDGSGHRERLTRGDLVRRVAGFAARLEALGVAQGDRVVAIVRNDANAVISGLAVAALGASLSTASPEMGAYSILARFGQLGPTLLMCHLEDASGHLGERILEVVRGLPSVRAVVALDDGPAPPGLGVPVHRSSSFQPAQTNPVWRRFPFNQLLFILFSSGTTGPPKCIMHGAGGTLIEHLKEHRLHGDLRASDKLFFQTSCSWMMWNWQLSALATGAEIVLYSGPVPEPATLWRLVSEERVTVFGTSPAYLQLCEDAGYSPRAALPLPELRTLMSTGSILFDHQYDWVAANVGPLPVQSISGGTDIVGCFVLGNPDLPVYRGESQCRSLALDVQAQGATPTAASLGVGELVCRNPFPSRPLGFFADVDGKRFHDAYFKQNEGVWSHGDLIEFTAHGSARLHGRSDGVLNVHGIRIGPAEIYRILHGLPEVELSLVVEQRLPDVPGQSRLVLLLVLRPGVDLDGKLRRRIRLELATRASAAHVPEIIVRVAELPTTHSGKRSERAVRDVVNGREAANVGALKNPASLEEIRRALGQEEGRRAARAEARPGPLPLEKLLVAIWEWVLDLAPVSPDDNFFDLGGTSLLALRMCNELRERTGHDLSPSMLVEAPTVARLAAAIERDAGRSFSSVVPMKSTGERRPIFFVHGLAGDLLELRALADRLPRSLPAFGFRARGLDAREQPDESVEQLAAYYLEQLRRTQPVGPYRILGYSFGGLVAFEMGRRLREMGEPVDFIGLLDTELHEACLPQLERAAYLGLRKVHTGTTRLCKRVPALTALFGPLRTAIERHLHATFAGPLAAPWEAATLTPHMKHVEMLARKAFSSYRPKLLDFPVWYFRASARSPDFFDPLPVWEAATGGRLKVVEVPGDHFSMIRDPQVSELAQALSDRLEW